MKKLLVGTTLILIYSFAISQQPEFSKYVKQNVELSFEKNCSGIDKIKRSNNNSVTLMFFQDTSDSVSIYLNGILMIETYLQHDSDLVSTDYTGFAYSNEYIDKKNVLLVAFRKSASYIEFNLDKKFPLYSIHFYKPAKFYVSGRKCQLVIK